MCACVRACLGQLLRGAREHVAQAEGVGRPAVADIWRGAQEIHQHAGAGLLLAPLQLRPYRRLVLLVVHVWPVEVPVPGR